MKNEEVHQELALLGVSAEVHSLVDDLDLEPRYVPSRFLPSYSPPIYVKKHVHKSYKSCPSVQGRLFDYVDSPVWQMCGVPRKKTKRIRGLVVSRGAKRR